MKKFIPYLLIGILLAVLFFRGCREDRKLRDDTTEIDTVYVEKTIPGDTVKVVQTEFEPKIIYQTDPGLIGKIEQLESDKERLEFLLAKLSTKVYDTTYTFDRGSLSVTDTVQGSLLGRSWELKLKPITYTEKTITKTERKYPKFSFSLGLNTGLTTDFSTQFEKPFIGLNVGFRNRNGYQLEFGYNSLQQIQIGLSKDIWTVY